MKRRTFIANCLGITAAVLPIPLLASSRFSVSGEPDNLTEVSFVKGDGWAISDDLAVRMDYVTNEQLNAWWCQGAPLPGHCAIPKVAPRPFGFMHQALRGAIFGDQAG